VTVGKATPKPSVSVAFHALRGLGVRAMWSRPISARAESKLAPCMARPNLFSGD
jgi:hypothetical protein